jgi:hypothetical protein
VGWSVTATCSLLDLDSLMYRIAARQLTRL